MTACRLYSLHRVFLRFCLSEYGTYRTVDYRLPLSRLGIIQTSLASALAAPSVHSCADISIHSGHNPNVLLLSMNQYSGRSFLMLSVSKIGEDSHLLHGNLQDNAFRTDDTTLEIAVTGHSRTTNAFIPCNWQLVRFLNNMFPAAHGDGEVYISGLVQS